MSDHEGRCDYCVRPTTMVLCWDCVKIVRARLVTLGWLAGELETTLTRQAKSNSPYGEGSPAAETPLAYDTQASDAAVLLRRTVLAWGRELIAHGVAYRSTDARTVALARWLGEHALDLAKLESAGACLDDLDYAVETAMKCVDRPVRKVHLGDCGCGYQLFGELDDGDVLSCPQCHAVFDLAARRRESRAEGRNVLITARHAEQLIGEVHGVRITASRVRVWAARRHFLDHGLDPETGCKLYRMGDILDYLDARFDSTPAKDLLHILSGGD